MASKYLEMFNAELAVEERMNFQDVILEHLEVGERTRGIERADRAKVVKELVIRLHLIVRLKVDAVPPFITHVAGGQSSVWHQILLGNKYHLHRKHPGIIKESPLVDRNKLNLQQQ